MPFTIDPEYAAVAKAYHAAKSALPKLQIGDVQGMRTRVGAAVRAMTAGPIPSDVTFKDYYTTTPDGHKMLLRWYSKKPTPDSTTSPSSPTPAALFIHGGGMILGDVPMCDKPIGTYVSNSSIPLLAVEFRYAPESPHPYPVNDCFCALEWLRDHAGDLNVDASRIGIFGESGGGGIAAGLALYARDKGFSPPVAKQILVYPMLDDRTTRPDPEIVPWMVWDYEGNQTAWTAVLGDKVGGPKVSEYCAAARAKDVTGLPPTYIEVGELDIFRDEDVEYATRLWKAGVSCELHVHPGVAHAFEGPVPSSDVATRSHADRVRALRSFPVAPGSAKSHV
ncbi:alpha/beta hydrolase [Aulographum hederae CBS 113979]|uniref:Alpha/beta hydrolase n=1 Tax=Aulographum hederae CBS 113979 TaxID=1176131 RepID=A0A6G1H2R6_9PEZI|nr:alpha/beta hydrolase [Aulographum hederae CBS 113979]